MADADLAEHSGPIVVVATRERDGDEHPTVDDWVTEHARAQAARSGVVPHAYLGREDVLPGPRDPDVSCHVFAAAYPEPEVTKTP